MRVHLEGMGLTGCLLAWRLERAGVPFTWHDSDAPRTAWKASTGAIYPGGGLDRVCYDTWQDWMADLEDVAPGCTEPAGYWFNHKRPPHDGDYEVLRRVPGAPDGSRDTQLSLAALHSWHINAQTLVPALRERYKEQQVAPVSGCAERGRYIIAHGFPGNPRHDHVFWGWTRKVQLELDPQLGIDSTRSAFYFRRGLVTMAYAYPVPGTDWWYAGSSLIRQRNMKELEYEKKYARWRREFEALSGGLVRVAEEGEFLQGWRPAQSMDREPPKVTMRDGKLVCPPLWNSGIRHYPEVWRQLSQALGLSDCAAPESPAP